MSLTFLSLLVHRHERLQPPALVSGSPGGRLTPGSSACGGASLRPALCPAATTAASASTASTGFAASVPPASRVPTAASVRRPGGVLGWEGCAAGPSPPVCLGLARTSLCSAGVAGDSSGPQGFLARPVPEACGGGGDRHSSTPLITGRAPEGHPGQDWGWQGLRHFARPPVLARASFWAPREGTGPPHGLLSRPLPPQTLTSASPRLAPTGPRAWTRSTAITAAARRAGPAHGARMVGGGTGPRGAMLPGARGGPGLWSLLQTPPLPSPHSDWIWEALLVAGGALRARELLDGGL